ncbi:Nitrogen assimilation transcription factor nit-4 [Colletotrichum siamense]|uniref:Nitrogen assimilation transcription factor nit-4 n=1 Tax=Colletotrichum siamense TaxID=690259 RepID=UPI001872CDBF|nr:Nitrogen assimilation transcription factor nit-4 [Colletotrichum siamense]KAF5506420.1 Nitrogen assimilation transcription factor nit-4 [Colletotrichum siamense]
MNPNTVEGNVDYSYANPLSSSGSDYPCKGHLSVLGTSEADPVATWNAGEDHTITLSGHTTHNGGSCQVSMSVDGGNTFKVLRSVIGGCPAGDGYQISFTLPDDTPSSDQAILAWSWFNNLGNREMYMNCAVIRIGNGGSGNNFGSQPDIFRANVGNGCRTVDNADVMIPNPGCNVELVSSNAVPPTGDCESGPVQGRATIHEQVLALLKNLPEEAAQDVFQRIRSGADATTIVNHVEAGDLLLQMAVTPETRLRYDFPYRSEMPEIYIQNNPYLNSFIYEAASLYSAHGQGRPSHATASGSQELQSVYTKPFHAAQVVEPRLSDAKVSWWTNVCDDDSLMRDLLRALFRCEYQFSAAFQKDLFLEDLVAQKQDFCSSLLVNITLAYACVCYPQFSNRVEYWNPDTLGYRFLAEAKRLWELQTSEPRVTTIQAGILFSVFHNLCGLDEIGQPYRIHGVNLARWAYTAWALYNWETLVAFSFMIPPLVKEPPDWPLPDPTREGGWYGEIWLQYSLVPGLQPTHFGHIFRTRAKFRVIMNEYCDAAFSPNGVISLDKANSLHEKLRRWYSDLPEPLQPKTIALPGHFQLHIYYYHLLLMIYEPLLAASKGRDATLQKVVADAKKYLQTLIRLYYLRHGYEAMDLFLVIPLMLTGYDCINAILEEKSEHQIEILRSTLILVAKGLQNQRRNHYLAEALFRVIRGRMRPQEVVLLRSSMTFDDDQEMEKHDMVQAVRSHWPVSIVKTQEEVDDHILTHLVESYGSLNLEETAR